MKHLLKDIPLENDDQGMVKFTISSKKVLSLWNTWGLNIEECPDLLSALDVGAKTSPITPTSVPKEFTRASLGTQVRISNELWNAWFTWVSILDGFGLNEPETLLVIHSGGLIDKTVLPSDLVDSFFVNFTVYKVPNLTSFICSKRSLKSFIVEYEGQRLTSSLQKTRSAVLSYKNNPLEPLECGDVVSVRAGSKFPVGTILVYCSGPKHAEAWDKCVLTYHDGQARCYVELYRDEFKKVSLRKVDDINAAGQHVLATRYKDLL